MYILAKWPISISVMSCFVPVWVAGNGSLGELLSKTNSQREKKKSFNTSQDLLEKKAFSWNGLCEPHHSLKQTMT